MRRITARKIRKLANKIKLKDNKNEILYKVLKKGYYSMNRIERTKYLKGVKLYDNNRV